MNANQETPSQKRQLLNALKTTGQASTLLSSWQSHVMGKGSVNMALLIGFAAISVVAGLFDNYHKRAKDFENIEIEGVKREDISFEERHQDIDRAKKIAFSQGAIDRKHQNRALIASETSFHDNFATGLLCLKACPVIAAFFSLSHIYRPHIFQVK